MIGRHALLGCLGLVLSQNALAAPFEGRFDLVCEGKLLNTGSEWQPRYSVDIPRGLFCAINTKNCDRKPPQKISGITPEVLVLVDRPMTSEKAGMLGKVNSITNELTVELYQPSGLVMFARAICRRDAFTPFPTTRTP